MSTLLTLLGKDFANLLRNRGALILSLVVPMLIIYIVGMVFGLGRSNPGPTSIPLAVVNTSADASAQKIVDALRVQHTFNVITEYVNPDKTTRTLVEDDLRQLIHDRKFSYALVIPSDFMSDEHLGLHLKIVSDPRNDIESQMVNGLLQQAIFSSVPNLLGKSILSQNKRVLGAARSDQLNRTLANDIAASFGGDPKTILESINNGDFGINQLMQSGSASSSTESTGNSNTDRAASFMSKLVKIDHEQVIGADVKSPTATRIVGGYAVMFLLFALSGSSAAFFDEKNSGIFRRLLSAPVSRAQLLWSRFVYGVLFGLAQLTTLFLAGELLYGVDAIGHIGNLIVVCICVAAACTAFGMLLSAITRSAAAASSLATLIVIFMSACGGAWFPISLMPEFMQHIAHYTLVYWAIEAFGAVLWAGDSFVQLLPILGVLLGITAVVMSVALWRFNRSPLFE
ncbi:MAG TPA: ABC transporter permease [Steroidobacteraceae bacterium]|nr:ABC transporter permease [Steroidobacteraceae bacterium]